MLPLKLEFILSFILHPADEITGPVPRPRKYDTYWLFPSWIDVIWSGHATSRTISWWVFLETRKKNETFLATSLYFTQLYFTRELPRSPYLIHNSSSGLVVRTNRRISSTTLTCQFVLGLTLMCRWTMFMTKWLDVIPSGIFMYFTEKRFCELIRRRGPRTLPNSTSSADTIRSSSENIRVRRGISQMGRIR